LTFIFCLTMKNTPSHGFPSPSGRGLDEGLRICRDLHPHPARFACHPLPLPEGEVAPLAQDGLIGDPQLNDWHSIMRHLSIEVIS
jgi:hypothetical protein